MKERSWVRELLLPLDEYATVAIDRTLQDALEALHRAQSKVPPGRQPHRLVLVLEEDGTIVGKLDYHTILSALLPQQEQQSVFLGDAMRRAGLTDNLMATSMRHLRALQHDLPNLCDRARHISIRSIVTPRPATIGADASLHELLSTLVREHAISLLVAGAGEVHGIVRLSDVFDEVTRTALGKGAEGCEEDG